MLGHLLKWQYQPQQRSPRWLSTIRVQRRDTQRLIQDNPSLKPYLQEVFQEADQNGRDLAVGETDLFLKTFPPNCLYTLEEILDSRFYPGEPNPERENDL